MFKLLTRAAWLGCCIGVVMSGADARGAATISLKAVKKNGIAIDPPTNDITVAVNDTITAELKFSGWGHPKFDASGAATGLVSTYQGQLDGLLGVQSSGPGHGLVLPIGWDAPLTKDFAPCTDPLYPVSDQAYGCVGLNFHPEQMVSIDETRTDFLLSGFQPRIVVPSFDSLAVRWGGTIFADGGQLDSRCVGGTSAGVGCTTNGNCTGGGTCQQFVFYGGTLELRAEPARAPGMACLGGSNPGVTCTSNADCPGGGTCVAYLGRPAMCGNFTFNLGADINVTFISNPLEESALPLLEPLVIKGPPCTDTGACCDGSTGVCTNNVTESNCQGAGMRFGGIGSTCLTLNPPCTASGACCDEDTGVCTNNVLPANCLRDTDRFGGLGSTCATLNPPCSVPPPTGACCNQNTGVCTNGVTQANCTGTGRVYRGDGTTCATSPPCAAPRHIVSSSPPHCAIDARIPFTGGVPANVAGFTSITLTFDGTAGTAEDSAGDYTIQQFPAGTPSVIQGVVIGGVTATITFTQPIQTRRWTCVLHNASNTRACLGYLPADANGDRTAAPVDILDIIDNLNGVTNPALPIYQCDVDRSALCAPADILTEIDLLNGASGFPVANGTTLLVCPSTTGP